MGPDRSGNFVPLPLQILPAHRGTISSQTNDQSGCWNPLQRSLVIGSELVTVGMNEVEFTDRATLTPRSSVQWGDPQQYGCVWYANG